MVMAEKAVDTTVAGGGGGILREMQEEAELDLPDECWELVFQHLGQSSSCWQAVSMTCRRFLYISNRSRPFIALSSACAGLPGGLPRILARFTGVTEVDLSRYHGSLARPLDAIAQAGLPLRSLNLQGQQQLPADAIHALGRRCPHLRDLNCSRFQAWDDADLALVAEAFPALETLDISNPQHGVRMASQIPPDPAFFPALVSDAGVRAMAARLHRLRSLNLSGHCLLSDAALESLAMRCRSLEELTVFDCPFVTDRGLHLLAVHCDRLTTLAVNGRRVTAAGIEGVLSSASKRLLSLNLCHMHLTDEVLEQLAEPALPPGPSWFEVAHYASSSPPASSPAPASSLHDADPDADSQLDDSMPQSPAGSDVMSLSSQQWPALLHDPLGIGIGIGMVGASWSSPLRKLVLAHCKGLTRAGLLHVARGCHRLHHLDLEGAHFLRDADTAELARSFPELEFLRLNHCSMLSDTTLVAVLKHCPHLETLEMEATAVGWGTEMTDMTLACKVKHLGLAWNRAVGDKILHCIARLFPELESLNLSNCLPVTGAGLAMVGRGCPGLTHLYLRGCKNVHSLEGVLENAGMIIENRCTMSENQGRLLCLGKMEDGNGLRHNGNGGGNGNVNAGILAMVGRGCGMHSSGGHSRGLPPCLGKKMDNTGAASLYESNAGIVDQAGFRQLEHLELEGSGFTDAGLVAVSRHSRSLTYLGLEGCNKVSDGGLKSVMEDCKLLKQLNLKDCIAISNCALAWMVFCRPSLRKLVLPSTVTTEGERARLTRHGCELIIKH